MTTPNLFSIPAGAAFADELVRGIYARYPDARDPLWMAKLVVLVPTRRAIRVVRDAFERSGEGRVVALPQVIALGDVDEDESPLDVEDGASAVETFSQSRGDRVMSVRRRELLFTRLIQFWAQKMRERNPVQHSGMEQPALALKLARDLANVLSFATLEGLSWERLPEIVPEELAEHWQLTVEFLSIITAEWPQVLLREGKSDPADHLNRVLRQTAQNWTQIPPPYPVIAAGSTGSVPATAGLLRVIARLPEGAVVLPGLDTELDEEAWSALNPGHPQYGMQQLLLQMEAARADVKAWTVAEVRRPRVRLLAEAMRPSKSTTRWMDYVVSQREDVSAGIDGMKLLVARTPQQEALAIACALREAAATPGKTAAFVTPSRQLARRVAGELKRWNILIDDSAGMPLSNTESGRFLDLVLDAVVEQFAPVPLLALLKHPLTMLGYDHRDQVSAEVQQLEIQLLRGPRLAPGLDTLVRAAKPDAVFQPLLGRLKQACGPLTELAQGTIALGELIHAHMKASSLLSLDTTSENGGVWDGDAGAAAFTLLETLAEEAVGTDLVMTVSAYRHFVREVMVAESIRSRFGNHPRLSILGPLEARLIRADLTILGGLNEGNWPKMADPGPWLNRPMRKELGVSQPEIRTGLSAHDFCQAACGKEVLLTRAEKEDGAPTTPSRWLTRLSTLVNGANLEREFREYKLLEYVKQLERPAAGIVPELPPKPCPPVAVRPRVLSVTRVEKWIRDPYSIYARFVLNLEKLDALDEAPGAADRGDIIHKALEEFVKLYPTALPEFEFAYSQLLKLGEAQFVPWLDRPAVRKIWWPRFERAARWFLEWEYARRVRGLRVVTESLGRIQFAAPAGTFELKGKADRIDVWPDGSVSIGDYKTGTVPGNEAVRSGLSPQLTLEGAIALQGGFEGLREVALQSLYFVGLKGGAVAGEETVVDFKDVTAQQGAQLAFKRFKEFVAAYDEESMPYHCKPRVFKKTDPSDYDHLARVKEWSADARDGD